MGILNGFVVKFSICFKSKVVLVMVKIFLCVI